MRRALKCGKRWLILGHRWLGIATCLLFALWIGSGLVMLYVPFPAQTEAERLARLAPLDLAGATVEPDVAIAAAGLTRRPPRFDLEMRGAEPVYRIAPAEGAPLAVSAGTGAVLGPAGAEEALRLAGAEPGRGRVVTVERDQWTVTARYEPLRPFHKVALGDASGTELYVSRVTGDIALDTTRFERGWNWVGAVTHWVYLTPLRARADLWRDVVLWLSGACIPVALSGLVLGVWRLRVRTRYRHGTVTPYRGLARWHHLFGLAGGVALTGFIVSGWLSMNPNRWFTSPRPTAAILAAYAGADRPVGPLLADLGRTLGPDIVSLRFSRVGGDWIVTAFARDGHRDVLRAPDARAIEAAAARALPGARLLATEPLNAYDRYWYPHHESRALPVLRLRFDDADATWLHIDPLTGTLLSRLDATGRLERWLFSALHRLDLPILIFNRPAWDAAQWLLNLLGAVVALTGIVIGWRRIRRARPTTVAIPRG